MKEPNRYNPSRGGHAPGHLRSALVQCIEDRTPGPWYSALADENVLSFMSAKMQERWEDMPLEERGRWLTGRLWNCTDVLPGTNCDDLDLPRGSTYALAARKLRAEIES
jgi:hypothetical protein